jgi:hypothetical protein
MACRAQQHRALLFIEVRSKRLFAEGWPAALLAAIMALYYVFLRGGVAGYNSGSC